MYTPLRLYVFSLPFLKSKYRETKLTSLVSDIRDFCMYQGWSPQLEYKYETEKTFFQLSFRGGVMQGVFQTDVETYFPSCLMDVFFEKGFGYSQMFFEELVNIGLAIGREEYVYEIDETVLKIPKNAPITIEELSKCFGEISSTDIIKFLHDTPKENIEEYLVQQPKILHSLYFLMYLCYEFTKALTLSENTLQNTSMYSHQSLLAKKRLESVGAISKIQFERYLEVLRKFFGVFGR